MSDPSEAPEQESELDRINRPRTVLDDSTGVTGSDLELSELLRTHSTLPDISAQAALDKIFDDKIDTDPISGEEFEFDEYAYLEHHQINYSNAVLEQESPDIIKEHEKKFEVAKDYIKRRSSISVAFYHEIGEIRARRSDNNHLLIITQDDPTKPIQQVRLSKISVAEWASKNARIDISEWKKIEVRSARTHSTELLEVLNAVIEEFWENRDKNERPTYRDAVLAWMKEQFPELVSIGILSEKMQESIYTITRPR